MNCLWGFGAVENMSQLTGGVYLHDVVVHQRSFIYPVDADVHTQNIEYLWMRAKRKLRRPFGSN